ncbi:UDP-N-acetyl-D-mannosaminuronic acid transferase [Neosynechococcus sphagnicola sy1]|uniref:UDP-N-acetyl-D-mannosaminuronic acid transferase n=1 Tax=Neosynechococcus sphagnicola sy1 TaxID=1497020 RepID=A0A098TP27_9CYAN|nr:WecB/TagA/CpsF family glycosyltransferase [Neosynechococcus sphagnicola]KGF73617.1 UDP-N-acetyl-D-mannosaminuronic acid transferase [Neosynechococcus sphagnicola sy1]
MSQAIAQTPATFPVLGIPLHLLENYAAWLAARLRQHQGGHVVTLNAEMAMQAEKTPELAQVIRQAELVIPDGAGVVLYLKLYGHHVQRSPGIELAEALIQDLGHQGQGHSVFFFGAAPGVADKAAQVWQHRLPNLAIAGSQHGFLSQEDQPAFRQTLQALQPSLILVGLGVPRQEYWIAEHRALCPHAIWIGVGGSLDIWAGTKERAPKWLREHHLEWVYRLYQEPWRWRRMLALPHFAWKALLARIRH